MDKINITLLHQIVKALLCAAVLFMLFAGLRPHTSYSDNWVSFNDNEGFTVFKRYGLAIGDLEEPISTAFSKQSVEMSMSVNLRSPYDNRFEVLAQIDSPESRDPLIIGQWQSYLIVMSGRDYRHAQDHPRITVDLSEHLDAFIDITIKLTPDDTTFKLDQQIMRIGPVIPFIQPPNRITIGNAPDGRHGWKGDVRFFQLQSTLTDQTRHRYQFDNNDLPNITDADNTATGLTIPRPGQFPDTVSIGTLRVDQLINDNLADVIINFLGFIPFGFLMCAAIAFGRGHYTALTSTILCIVAGFLLSLAIESAQAYIPGRSPHAHDLFFNTLGAAAGVLSFQLSRALQSFLARQPTVPDDAKNPEPPENR